MNAENNLDTDRIKGLVWRLALPSMLAQFVSVFYSIVDRMYIGNIAKTGEIALAGVGICGPIVSLISSFAFLVGTGGSPLMSIRMGEKNERAAKQILANSFLVLLIVSVGITFLSFLFKDRMLHWFGAEGVIFDYADSYLSLYLTGTVFALLSAGLNPFIICQGFAKAGMKAVLYGAVLNILLDPVFIFSFGLGVKGAALATVLSQMVSCAYGLTFLFGQRTLVKITFKGYDCSLIKRILTLGLSPFLIVAFDNILIITLNTVIMRYGGEGMKGMLLTCMTIVQSFMLMVTMPLSGITTGTQTILGYNYGGGRPDRIKAAEIHIAILALLFTSIMFVFANTSAGIFVRIFTQNETYVNLTVWAIRIYTMSIIPLALQYVVVDGFTGMGIAKAAIAFSMFRKCIFLVGAFVIPALYGAVNIFYTEPLSDLISSVVSVSIYIVFFNRIVNRK
ncbi:MATE family efflux transporter [Clostridium sp. E02]|uniref:MATE family efflux transporter n=1 Tax=Clostridium sp. E02 TaxID=2487134 RepID=UPI000F5281A9|nr:MATE family efflux transporter [Clostridium sp. E02]